MNQITFIIKHHTCIIRMNRKKLPKFSKNYSKKSFFSMKIFFLNKKSLKLLKSSLIPSLSHTAVMKFDLIYPHFSPMTSSVKSNLTDKTCCKCKCGNSKQISCNHVFLTKVMFILFKKYR